MPAQSTLVKAGCFDNDNERTINDNFSAINAALASGSGLIPASAVAAGLTGSQLAANTVGSSQLDPTTLQYVSGSIANAAVKTLFGTGSTLIAAQGAGTLIEVVSMVLENVFLTAAFTAGGAIQLTYGTTGVAIPASATIAATFLTSPTANQTILVAGALASNLSSGVLNKAITLACATQEFATGAGSLNYRITYRVHTGL